MTPERWQTVKELLDGALQRPAPERATFLDAQCGTDAELRREIESLLESEHDAADFLEPRAFEEPPSVDLRVPLQEALGATYRLEGELGRGGMSTVYLARDLKHGRRVAVKVLHEQMRTPVGVQRFNREVEVLARLQHPNVLPLYDSGVVNGAPYYVMPFIEGESLRARLRRDRQLAIEEALRLACEVADALGYAHAQGIVHRDVKPENILLSGGHALLADFGIGKLLHEADASITATGLIIGTPAYVSPEQGAGERDLDGRSDLYSLGIVLYEMLTGAPPFTGASPLAVIMQRFTDPVPPLRVHRAEIPEWVEHAVLTLLARTPADRFPTAPAFIRAITSADGARATMTAGRVTSTVAPPTEGTAGTATGRRSTIGAPLRATNTALRSAPSIVVLPFQNMSASAEDEFLSDGITEEIINALTRLRTMRVVARTSAFAFKGKAMDVRSIARLLEVGSVVEGSVRRAGSRVRVAAELIDVRDGCRVWAEQYDRQMEDVFALEDELAQRIADSLRVTLLGDTAGALVDRATADPEAHELYLKARYAWHKRTEQSLRQSITFFEAAIERDPTFAPALAGLADAHTILCIYGLRAPSEGMPQARTAALRALELDPSLADASATLGCVEAVYDWNWTGAERHFQHALTLGPHLPTARQRYALDCLTPTGRFADASRELEWARSLDPLSLVINTSAGLPWYFARRYEEASRAYRKALELDPTFGMAHYFLGQVHVQTGAYDDALAAFQKANELVGSTPEVRAALAHAYGVRGDRDRTSALLAELLEERRYVSPVLLAQVQVGLGAVEPALECLERASEERASDLVWLGVRPVFDPLRETDRFRAVLARIGLSA